MPRPVLYLVRLFQHVGRLSLSPGFLSADARRNIHVIGENARLAHAS
jgi:hypothetical protein